MASLPSHKHIYGVKCWKNIEPWVNAYVRAPIIEYLLALDRRWNRCLWVTKWNLENSRISKSLRWCCFQCMQTMSKQWANNEQPKTSNKIQPKSSRTGNPVSKQLPRLNCPQIKKRFRFRTSVKSETQWYHIRRGKKNKQARKLQEDVMTTRSQVHMIESLAA